jgi:pantetheine-phosphate adenylyltransferase
MTTAIYAGTFDPLTNGHLWMIQQGKELFDHLIVAIGINPAKKCCFSLGDRLRILIHAPIWSGLNVSIKVFNNEFLIDYAQQMNASFILRGIRTESDYEYERGMRYVNGDISKKIQTVFLMPPRDLAEVSSSMVKSLVGPDKWEGIVQSYVPVYAFSRIKLKHNMFSRWQDLWARIGAKGNAPEAFEQLYASYSDSDRHYHSLDHIFDCLVQLEAIEGFVNIQERNQVELALWIHDKVYNPEATNNEEQTAEFARSFLEKHDVSEHLIQPVLRLILATKHNKTETTLTSQLICDIDLASLGSDSFDINSKNIRHEYHIIPDDVYNKERAKILQMFLNRERIYYTELFREKYEQKARINLQREIDNLLQ